MILFAQLKAAPISAAEFLKTAASANGQDSRQIKILLGVILAVAALIFLFAWLRKRRRHTFRRSAWSDSQHRKKFSTAAKISTSRRYRRPRDHRPRNPTLDQTGGLPPKRETDSN